MFNIEFYVTKDGVSELWNFLDSLSQKALRNKDAKIQHKQIMQYIQLLADHGTRLGEKVTKHLDFSTIFGKRLRRHLHVRLIEPNPSGMIGFQERGKHIWLVGKITKNMFGLPTRKLQKM